VTRLSRRIVTSYVRNAENSFNATTDNAPYRASLSLSLSLSLSVRSPRCYALSRALLRSIDQPLARDNRGRFGTPRTRGHSRGSRQFRGSSWIRLTWPTKRNIHEQARKSAKRPPLSPVMRSRTRALARSLARSRCTSRFQLD